MRKFFSLFVAALFSATLFAYEGGTMTSSSLTAAINPTETVTFSYDGTGTNFANWEPKCFVHTWLVAASGQTFSKDYGTTWVTCNGDNDYNALDDKVKMTLQSKGHYTISMNLKTFFNVADEDLPKIAKWGIIVRAQYGGDNNQTNDFFFDVDMDPAKFYITGNEALLTDAGSTADEWSTTAIKVTEDSKTLSLKGNVRYKLKVTVDGTWSTAKGYSDLTGEKLEGIRTDNDNNILFRLTADGDVVVSYTASAFTITGSFITPLTDGHYLLGSNLNAWTAAPQYLFTETSVAGEYILKDVVLTVGDSIKVAYISNDEATAWFGTSNYVVDSAHAGTRDVYFRPAGNSPDWDEFGGYIWMGSNPTTGINNVQSDDVQCTKVLRDGQLLIVKDGKWYNLLGTIIR